MPAQRPRFQEPVDVSRRGGGQRPAEDGEDADQRRGDGGEQGVPALGERVLAMRDGLEDSLGEVDRDDGVLQRGQALHQRPVHGQLGGAFLAGIGVLARGHALGPAQRPVRQALDLFLGEVGVRTHGKCSASLDLSSLRARCNQVITVPIGTPMAAAISA